MLIGLAGMSAKPFHVGHAAMLERAAAECDHVIAYVSLSDRKRHGEFIVRGCDMSIIWRELIEPQLPKTVHVEYVKSPVSAIWHHLIVASNDPERTHEQFHIYGTDDDLQARFNDALVIKYVPTLYARNAIVRKATERLASGTSARNALNDNNFSDFLQLMPSWLDARRVWSILKPH